MGSPFHEYKASKAFGRKAAGGAGGDVLLLIDALARLGGRAAQGELMDATHQSKYSMSRTVKRANGWEFVEWDGQIVTLREDWRERVNEIEMELGNE